MDRSKTTMAGLGMAAVLFLAVNIFANITLNSLRMDLTEDKLYTISDGTRNVLGKLNEPILVRLYFSKVLGERSPAHAAYHSRIRELLEQYRSISGGKLQLELANPEPFSDAEDQAVAFGLKGMPVNSVGDLGYFGLAAVNSTDGKEVIAFFNREREQFIEYDLTKIIYSLASPDKKSVGLISSLPIEGARDEEGRQRSGAWIIANQIREFFYVIPIDPDAEAIPGNLSALMVVHPRGLAEKTLYAIDQFVLGGGKALVFLDPNAEIDFLSSAQAAVNAGPSDLDRLIKAWGVVMNKDKIAGDLDAARRVNAGGAGGKIVVADYVAWLGLTSANFAENDVATGDIKSINMASSGILEKAEGATTEFTPIITTGVNSMKINAEAVRVSPDVVSLFRNFRSEGKPLTLAARIKGATRSAFPDGPPKPKSGGNGDQTTKADGGGKHLNESVAPVNIIVVADADMLHERFWVQESEFLGQKVYIPFANNADFVINALDNLSGSDALIGLRGRIRIARPFHMVDEIRRDAEQNFRAKEEVLMGKLNDVQSKLAQLQGKSDESGNAILSADDKESLATLRAELVSTRKELRNVQLALRKDIDNLDAWLKFLNIAAIPLLLGGVFVVLMVLKRSRRSVKAMTTGSGS
ncbi:MAG: hypothetical protein A3G18_00595 [Rhodospirillales bacterium RIFCSPLOWO2_12_FULL_58_28]|nr:MAG: hypothetical protein A3H92_05530 [Rhodospirillales bacterium RIFCSPLOWO2_02_FULL_58_16]OHC77037.1 MAG: hypothetical protein A3G18_00595 [Rhodospirillales bacterium RIFCSPLOWO2_12_FULL_58_28]